MIIAANISGPIPEGRLQLDVADDDPVQRRNHVMDIVMVLRAGALPAPVELVSVERRGVATP